MAVLQLQSIVLQDFEEDVKVLHLHVLGYASLISPKVFVDSTNCRNVITSN